MKDYNMDNLSTDNLCSADNVYMSGDKIVLEFNKVKNGIVKKVKKFYYDNNSNNMALVRKVYGKITNRPMGR